MMLMAVSRRITILTSAIVLIVLCSRTLAVDVWPRMALSLEGGSVLSDRGLILADDLSFGVNSRLDYEPVTLTLAGHFAGNKDNFSKYMYDMRVLTPGLGGRCAFGLRGALFDAESNGLPDDRSEVYLSLGSSEEKASLIRWSCVLAYCVEGSDAVYADTRLAATRGLSSWMDLEVEAVLGWGDKSFAERHANSQLGEEGELDAWWNVRGEVSFPIMLGSMDVVPSVSYSAVLNGSARSVLTNYGQETEKWAVGLAVVLYFE